MRITAPQWTGETATATATTPYISLVLEEVPLVELRKRLDVLVGADNVLAVSLDHEERLAERAGALVQHVLGPQGNDGTEGKDEVVDVGLVEVEGRDGVRHGV